jgi:hypothetical protein
VHSLRSLNLPERLSTGIRYQAIIALIVVNLISPGITAMNRRIMMKSAASTAIGAGLLAAGGRTVAVPGRNLLP